jgi:tetratricopeptide (TPR) repeat protein
MFWFVLTLAPPVIVAPMVSEHDRYLYLSAYAFCALIAWASLRLGSFWTKAPYVIALCVVILWSGLTWHEMGYWDCDKTLWSRVLEISPSQPKAIIQMAQLYCEEGDSAKAISLLNEGVRYYPTSPKFWLEQARTLNDVGRFDEARTSYLKVMQLTEPVGGRPAGTLISTNARAAAAHQLAIMDLKANNLVEAESYARTSLAANPEAVSYHSTLSEILIARGRVDEAVAEGKLELQLSLARQLGNRWSPHP